MRPWLAGAILPTRRTKAKLCSLCMEAHETCAILVSLDQGLFEDAEHSIPVFLGRPQIYLARFPER
jgi:hypothetical protein